MALPAPHPDDDAPVRPRARVAIPALLVLAFGAWWIASSAFVSAEMSELRSIESRLDLPEDLGRTENDSGQRSDWKGVNHNDRYVLLYFGHRDSMDDIVAAFAPDDWVLDSKIEREPVGRDDGGPIAGVTRWRFTSMTEPACASVWFDWKDSGDISDSGVFIFHTSSDACR